jgi:DNA-binding NarL/FixJ family response regulator
MTVMANAASVMKRPRVLLADEHQMVADTLKSVEKVLKGSSYVTPRVAKGQANIFLRGPQASERTAEPTLRQREVIQLMAEGHSMKEAAAILKITLRTVACHKYAGNGITAVED